MGPEVSLPRPDPDRPCQRGNARPTRLDGDEMAADADDDDAGHVSAAYITIEPGFSGTTNHMTQSL
jgi:hypothetical protein